MVLTALQAERDAAFAERDAERDAAHAERVAEHTRQDALERRITDLYTKAAEQLGHSQAAVRLAGLYSLERLAQDNVSLRQTVVNVICAYLRTPYTPLAEIDQARARRMALREARRRYRAFRTERITGAPLSSSMGRPSPEKPRSTTCVIRRR
ncbi:hypothetical protein GCM10023194_47230 [Planotetraspora phitsanulokensis]|uniref:Uncharacterized protein n=2 Tax=Planotetraspora phitsanulokensis TaxID=575192 RepID=A0A8J3UCY1_9ACTN|nr:hypothetical protein Pph01_81860 [Planotetraspora phitsanulokensis]